MQSNNGAGCFAIVIQEINDGLEGTAGLVDVYAFGNSCDNLARLHTCHAQRILRSSKNGVGIAP